MRYTCAGVRTSGGCYEALPIGGDVAAVDFVVFEIA